MLFSSQLRIRPSSVKSQRAFKCSHVPACRSMRLPRLAAAASEQGQQEAEPLVQLLQELKATVNSRFDQVDARFDQVDARFEQVETRIEQVETRIEQVETRFDTRFDQVDTRIEQVETRFDTRFDQVEKKLGRTGQTIGDLAEVLVLSTVKARPERIQGLRRAAAVISRAAEASGSGVSVPSSGAALAREVGSPQLFCHYVECFTNKVGIQVAGRAVEVGEAITTLRATVSQVREKPSMEGTDALQLREEFKALRRSLKQVVKRPQQEGRAATTISGAQPVAVAPAAAGEHGRIVSRLGSCFGTMLQRSPFRNLFGTSRPDSKALQAAATESDAADDSGAWWDMPLQRILRYLALVLEGHTQLIEHLQEESSLGLPLMVCAVTETLTETLQLDVTPTIVVLRGGGTQTELIASIRTTEVKASDSGVQEGQRQAALAAVSLGHMLKVLLSSAPPPGPYTVTSMQLEGLVLVLSSSTQLDPGKPVYGVPVAVKVVRDSGL